MTTRKEALIALRDKVRDGDADIDRSLPWSNVFGWTTGIAARNAYRGSNDAAVTLCEAVLPEWEWDVSSYGGTDDRASAKLQVKGDPIDKEWQWGVDEIPARALLLAILEALIAEEE